jgi:AcrR family transcriptional regulator
MYETSILKRPTYHHGNLSESLIALALNALERGGPETLSLSALAAQAGVSGMAPYRHFKDRAALLEAVARRGFEMLRADLVAVDDAAEPRKALVAFGAAYVRFALRRPGLFRVMFDGAPPTPDEALSADGSTVYGLFLSRIAQAAAPAQRMDAFLACWCLMHGLASLSVAGRLRSPDDPEALASRLGEFMLARLD